MPVLVSPVKYRLGLAAVPSCSAAGNGLTSQPVPFHSQVRPSKLYSSLTAGADGKSIAGMALGDEDDPFDDHHEFAHRYMNGSAVVGSSGKADQP